MYLAALLIRLTGTTWGFAAVTRTLLYAARLTPLIWTPNTQVKTMYASTVQGNQDLRRDEHCKCCWTNMVGIVRFHWQCSAQTRVPKPEYCSPRYCTKCYTRTMARQVNRLRWHPVAGVNRIELLVGPLARIWG